MIHPQSIRTAVLEEDAVWQFRAIQKANDHLYLAVVSEAEADRDEMRRRLTTRITKLFGEETRLEIDFVDSIDRGDSGSKFRVVVSRCRPQ